MQHRQYVPEILVDITRLVFFFKKKLESLSHYWSLEVMDISRY